MQDTCNLASLPYMTLPPALLPPGQLWYHQDTHISKISLSMCLSELGLATWPATSLSPAKEQFMGQAVIILVPCMPQPRQSALAQGVSYGRQPRLLLNGCSYPLIELGGRRRSQCCPAMQGSFAGQAGQCPSQYNLGEAVRPAMSQICKLKSCAIVQVLLRQCSHPEGVACQ